MATWILSLIAAASWTAIASTTAAVVGIISATYQFVVVPIWRRRKLAAPCSASFRIPASSQRAIDYVIQDGEEHYVEQLTLTSHSEFEIEILYKPTISFAASEIYFGCGEQNYADLASKPMIDSLCNLFSERGTPEESPDTHPETNWTDRHKFYHIRKPKIFPRNETHSLGFKMQTRDAGTWTLNMFFTGEEVGRLKNKLLVRVEDHPTTKMACTLPDHRHKRCVILPIELADQSG
jgi:hypothetical protein